MGGSRKKALAVLPFNAAARDLLRQNGTRQRMLAMRKNVCDTKKIRRLTIAGACTSCPHVAYTKRMMFTRQHTCTLLLAHTLTYTACTPCARRLRNWHCLILISHTTHAT